MIKNWLSHINDYQNIYLILCVIGFLISVDDRVVNNKEFSLDLTSIASLTNDLVLNIFITAALSGMLYILSNATARIMINNAMPNKIKSAQQGDAPEPASPAR
jgi:hypothetical protein